LDLSKLLGPEEGGEQMGPTAYNYERGIAIGTGDVKGGRLEETLNN